MAAAPLPTKVCASCGRVMAWRRAWARDWDARRFCSDACRRRGVRDVDHALERAIVDLLARRADGQTICPSEAARAVDAEGWRELMEPARRAARRLVQAGAVEITQRGKVVDPSTARGPVRLRRARREGLRAPRSRGPLPKARSAAGPNVTATKRRQASAGRVELDLAVSAGPPGRRLRAGGRARRPARSTPAG